MIEATLEQIYRWFKRGSFPTEDQYSKTWASFWHKSEKLPIEQIDGLAQEIAKATTNFKGYHTDETALKKAYPKAENKKDFFAWVGVSPTFIWKVDANGGDWRNTGDEPTQQEIDLSGYAKQTDIDKLEKTIENIPTEAIIDINSEVTRGGKYLFFGQGHPESNVIDMYEDILTVDNTYIVQSGSTGSGNLYKSSVHIPLFSTDGRIRFYGFGSSSSARALAFYTETNQVVKVVENINSDFGILQEVEIPQGAHNFIICKHKDHPFMCSILLGESDQIVNEKDEWSIVEVSKGVATKADSIIKPNIFLATKTTKPRKTISYLVEKGEYPNFGYRGTRYGNEILTMAGYLDRGNGSFRENSSYKSSDFMPIRDYEDFIYTPIASETACAIAFYKDGSFLYSDKHGDSSSVRPSNATHFRICGRTDHDYFIIIKHPLGELTSLSIVEPSIVSFVNGDWAVRPLSNSNKSKPASNFVPRVICKLEDFKHPTIENGKINIVGNNSPNPKQILLDVDTYIERLCMRTTFSMSSDDSKLIIGKGGSRMEIDTSSKKIRFYQMTNSLGEDDLYKFDEVPLKLDIIKNDKYVIGFHKIDEYELRFFIYGSNGSFERVFDKRNSSSELRTAIAWHRPYFGVISGIVQVHDSVMLSDYHIDSEVLITGDSFIEGTSLFAYGGELEDRWCYLLAERIGLSRTVISGHGGESINGRVINRLKKEISWFPNIKYVIVSLGTNNEDSSYISYMGDLIDYLESINVTPIIVTITPKGGDQRVKNNWIKNRGVPYIDMHKATASQSDGSVWKSGYVMSDGVHPTPIGHKKMDEQIIIDCPFLG